VSAERITSELEKACGFSLSGPEFLNPQDMPIMRLRRKNRLSLECARSTCGKNGESVIGDSVTFFENEDGFFYSLICDGMGSGRDAAIASRLASVFLEKLMSVGGPKGATLEMLNSFLIARSDECFTTVDLLEVDLISAEACFIKAGAAPAFVVRGSRIFKVNSATPPAGIIYNMTAEQTRLILKEGDVIVMLSDGLCDAQTDPSECPWLMDLIGFGADSLPSEMAEKIMEAASSQHLRTDDMTVAVIRVGASA
jgi:stage II sporulation protein E